MSTFPALTRLQCSNSQHRIQAMPNSLIVLGELTNYHDIKVESFSHTLSVPLIWQIGKTNIASQFSAHYIPHIARRQSCRFRVLRADGLCRPLTHGVAALDIWSCSFAVWNVWRRRCPGRGRYAVYDGSYWFVSVLKGLDNLRYLSSHF